MKKCILLLSLVFIIGCTQSREQKKIDNKGKEELKIDTRLLKSLNDSLNSTGDYQYYEKYISKINEMIKKYPDPYREDFIEVRESMKDIFE